MLFSFALHRTSIQVYRNFNYTSHKVIFNYRDTSHIREITIMGLSCPPIVKWISMKFLHHRYYRKIIIYGIRCYIEHPLWENPTVVVAEVRPLCLHNILVQSFYPMLSKAATKCRYTRNGHFYKGENIAHINGPNHNSWPKHLLSGVWIAMHIICYI